MRTTYSLKSGNVTSFGFVGQLLYAKVNDPCSIAAKLPNGYQSLLVVVIVVAVMPIWLRKSGGRNEHKEDKH